MNKGTWNEIKYKLRNWRFKYSYFTRKRPRKKYGRFIGKQYAIKRNKNAYNLVLRGKFK